MPSNSPNSKAKAKTDNTRNEELEALQETNVGKELSILTTKRVISLVLSIIISIPLFTPSTYLSPYQGADSGFRTLWLVNQTGNAAVFNLTLNNYISNYATQKNPLIGVNILSYSWFANGDENALRDSEKIYYNIQGTNSNDALAYAVFNHRPDNQLNAILSIVNTIFVTLVLTAAALYFSKDSNDLVLYPLESMLRKVKRIAENPLAATEIEEEDALLQEELKKRNKIRSFFTKKDEVNFETKILEKTILKLGALLALGFGEAGSNIIAQNMSKDGEVDPMIPGKKVMAIFGFCDIRNFTDATEVLQEGVMVFVNEIAEIVHSTINEYSGAANKNIGDAFLLVWKLPDEEVIEDPVNPSDLKLKRSIKISQLADMSIISFLKVIASIQKSKTLEKYSHNEELYLRLPNYSVKMGFGLHVGWAIEGAIGSEYKIDASYLSPNVNMASRLEAATKQFGVPILISGSVYEICTSEMKRQLRHIDTVTVKGSNQPVQLYTCDIDYTLLSIDKSEIDIANLPSIEKKKVRLASRTKRNEMREKAFNDQIRVSRALTTEKDLVIMRRPFSKEFSRLYFEGMSAYIGGNWTKAKECFEVTKDLIPDYVDGPSSALLSYMKDFNNKAPADWKGFRELTEK